MALIIDMNFEAFKKSGRDFYWQETSDRFVLARTQDGTVQRCSILKSNDENDILKLKNMLTGGQQCHRILFGDEKEPAKVVKTVDASKSPFQ